MKIAKCEISFHAERTWDYRARYTVYPRLLELFEERYRIDCNAAKNYVFMEGVNPLHQVYGKKGGMIFGANLYPDCIIRFDDGKKLAIELDNGRKGSGIKNAISKAGMLKLVGDFVAVAVYYFAYEGLEKIVFESTENSVKKFYKEKLSTDIFIV
jgi:hypothetical protein